MSDHVRFVALIVSMGLLVTTLHFVRIRKLRDEYALLWLAAGGAILALVLVVISIAAIAGPLSLDLPPMVVFSLGLFFVLAILMSQSVVITGLADRVRDLAQMLAILDWHTEHPTQRDGNRRLEPHLEMTDAPPPADASTPATAARRNPASGARRVLVIGLDGATFDLIEPWAASGDLPTFRRLLESGAWGRLRSTIPPMTAPAWTSFATGTNPGKHGLYDWVTRDRDGYGFRLLSALDCQVPTIYSLLSQAGRRVCTVNVPMTYPPTPVNGALISGLPAPSTRVAITYPSDLLEQVQGAVGRYELYPDPGGAYSDAGVEAFLRHLQRTGHSRVATFEYLRERERWDMAMVVFSGTDTVCHAMWRYMDPTHPLHEPRGAARYGNAIRDYYRFIDGYLASVLAGLDDDTTLVIMSDHGFGPFRGFIHVNNWLLEKGWLHLKDDPHTRLKSRLFRAGVTPMNVYDLLMRAGFGALKREVVRGQGQGLMRALFLSFSDVDWARTQAYSLGNVGQIRLNVAGRDPQGCVSPGIAYERLRDAIIAELAELADPDTGETVVESIHRREETYHGDALDGAADILFIPRRLEYFGFGEYEFGGNRVIEPVRHGISGTHRMDGVMMAYGRDIRPGLRVDGARIIDLAPTILHLMGEPIPDHMDGRVLQEIMEPERRSEPRTYGAAWQAPSANGNGDDTFSAEDEEVITRRLRDLGYLG